MQATTVDLSFRVLTEKGVRPRELVYQRILVAPNLQDRRPWRSARSQGMVLNLLDHSVRPNGLRSILTGRTQSEEDRGVR